MLKKNIIIKSINKNLLNFYKKQEKKLKKLKIE